ncbi:hypothetical protein [Mycolicibacterium stellerae]|uniref:hypothetical protein n=1 Tax=Mycolicibacterium stellerae TaxID=2358193 RepID=UPI000F0B5541|nr:hypothetical protein [Mycolicibacterium stellerae]
MGRPGIQTKADAVKKTVDGISLNVVWEELKDVTAHYSERRSHLVSLLTHGTITAADPVPQSLTFERMDRATEFGVPKAVGTEPVLLMGKTLWDFDKATRFSWLAARDMTFDQIRYSWSRIMEADDSEIARQTFKRIFTPTEGVNEQGHRVFGLWNGTDSLGPLPYNGVTFPTNTSHYIPTQNATLDSQDVEDAIDMITTKGYGLRAGSQILIVANTAQVKQISSWRAGVESRSSGPLALYSFIPSVAAPPYLTDQRIVGSVAPAEYNGLAVTGSYGRGFVIEHPEIPAGYVLVVATGGPDSVDNVLGLREHPDAAWRGLRPLPGNYNGYPLIESFAQRTFGVGTRHRSAAVCLQVTAGSTYTAPSFA